MGNYATRQDLIDRFEDDDAVSHLTDSYNEGIDTDVLDDLVTEVEGEVDSYLSERYEVPVDVSSDTSLASRLRGVTLDIAQFHLLARGDNYSEAKEKLHDKAIQWLKDVAAGKANLPAEEAPAGGASKISWGAGPSTDIDEDDRVFTRGNQSGL